MISSIMAVSSITSRSPAAVDNQPPPNLLVLPLYLRDFEGVHNRVYHRVGMREENAKVQSNGRYMYTLVIVVMDCIVCNGSQQTTKRAKTKTRELASLCSFCLHVMVSADTPALPLLIFKKT